jgi:hypothetical protein
MTRKATPDIMSQALSGKAAPAPGAPGDPGELLRVNFWLGVNWKATLVKHFKSQGLDLSSGIRTALVRYMKDEGLV